MAKYIFAALAGIAAAITIMFCVFRDNVSPAGQPVHPVPYNADTRAEISALIKGLCLSDPKARSISHRHLVEETGMFFGFKPSAFPEERDPAVRRWEKWWAANCDKSKEQWLTDSLSSEGYAGKPLALKVLAEMSCKASIPAIIALLHDPQAGLRVEAVRALGQLKAESAVAELSELLETDKEVRVRRAAVRSLGLIGSKDALAAIAATATQEDALTRIEAASAIVLHSPEDALPILYSLLGEGNDQARDFAVSRLAELRIPASVPYLVELLGGQEAVSMKAHEALQNITGKDLGTEPAPWIKWYEEQEKKHR